MPRLSIILRVEIWNAAILARDTNASTQKSNLRPRLPVSHCHKELFLAYNCSSSLAKRTSWVHETALAIPESNVAGLVASYSYQRRRKNPCL